MRSKDYTDITVSHDLGNIASKMITNISIQFPIPIILIIITLEINQFPCSSKLRHYYLLVRENNELNVN